MSELVIVALISLFGTLLGTFAGILTSAKLTTYRIEQLEKKQERYNNIIERTFILEGQMQEVQHEIIELKN